MRIFVGYRYGPRDVWVSKYVYRLVRAFSSEVVDGESVYSAHSLADGIVDSIINGCDGFIGVVSQEVATRPWVQHELGAARAANKLIVPLREKGVLQNFGMLEDKQFIEYDPTDLSDTLVKLADARSMACTARRVCVFGAKGLRRCDSS